MLHLVPKFSMHIFSECAQKHISLSLLMVHGALNGGKTFACMKSETSFAVTRFAAFTIGDSVKHWTHTSRIHSPFLFIGNDLAKSIENKSSELINGTSEEVR